MELTFNGHACFTLRSASGRVIVTDPYRSGAFGGRIAHAPLRVPADVATVSHAHVDHAHVTAALGQPVVVEGARTVRGQAFVVRPTYHDREGGSRMGMVGMVAFELDGLRIAHLGDVGCDVSPADAAVLGPVDVLLWPVGGRYTLGPEDAPAALEALRPRLAIPMHFESARCTLGLAPVEALLPHLDRPVSRPGVSTWSSAAGLPDEPAVLVLEPAL